MTLSSQKQPEHEVASPIKTKPDAVDPCAGRMRFGRRMYFFSSLAGLCLWGEISRTPLSHSWLPEKVAAIVYLLGLIAFPILILGPASLRARDLGMSGWNALVLLCPIVNIFLGYRLAFAPRGYSITKRADAFQRAVNWVLLGLLAVAIISVVIAKIVNR